MGRVIQDVGQDARGTGPIRYRPVLTGPVSHSWAAALSDQGWADPSSGRSLIRLRTLLVNGHGRLSFYEM